MCVWVCAETLEIIFLVSALDYFNDGTSIKHNILCMCVFTCMCVYISACPLIKNKLMVLLQPDFYGVLKMCKLIMH